jgi:nickel transport protein
MLETVTYKTSKFVLLLLFLSAVMLPKAEAHRVTVFAWTEGDMVHTQSKFGGGRKAQETPIQVFDLQGNLLLEGLTNVQGEFSFKAPGKMDLRIVLVAGTGHQAEWFVRAAEFGDTLSGEFVSAGKAQTREAIVARAAPMEASVISTAELQQVVEAAVDKKLQPVIRMLVEKNTAGPTFKDIMGGIGYIFGMVGIATYFRCRNKSA